MVRRTIDLISLTLATSYSFLVALLSVPFFILFPGTGQKFHHLFGLGWIRIMGIRVEVFKV